MPVEVNIIFDLYENLEYEETLYIQRNMKIRFIVRVWRQYLIRNQILRPLSLTLYFEGIPPDGFDKINTKISQEQYITNIPSKVKADLQPLEIILAEGIPTQPGEFKYGLRASNGEDEIFDEDPILIII